MTITVIVDDNDPAIEYSRNWTALKPSSLDSSGINQTIGNTLHSFNIGNFSKSSFTYNFTGITLSFQRNTIPDPRNWPGSSVSVFALMWPDAINGASLPYHWSCSVDSSMTTPVALEPLVFPTTVKLCDAANLQNGPHQLDFKILSTDSQNSTGYLDYIEYTPLASTTPQIYNYTGISFDDPIILYNPSNDWLSTSTLDNTQGRQISGLSNTTTIELNFTGVCHYIQRPLCRDGILTKPK